MVVTELVARMLEGDRRALARLITLLERGSDQRLQVMEAVHPRAGRAYCIGVTGPPGAGKSTLMDGLAQTMRRKGLSVGILAVDPTSPFSGGAVLGDRIRMQRHYLDEGIFIRSMATRGSQGGLSRMTRGAVKLLDAFGKDIIVVETVGVGQTELDIMGVADTVAVVLVPEAGDAVQTMKAGLMEIADIFVVNKADREGADRLVANIEAVLALNSQDERWRPPVVTTQAHKGEGVEELYQAIERHRATQEQSSRLSQRRRQRQKQEFMEAVEEEIGARLVKLVHQESDLGRVLAQVEQGEVDPYAAAVYILGSGSLSQLWLSALEKPQG